MNASLTHRGPDDEGYYVKGPAGLAMRRLSIIDVEGGHQPISNEDGSLWTVFNGEIYNFKGLREELLQKGHRFKSLTDTEVIVHLYEEEGETFVHKLRGMFAIALWDEKAEKLLLYRDRVGIKPLHYWHQNRTLVFGSEIKAVLCYPGVSREISLPALGDYLSFFYVPAPKTIYRDIHKLPPGHLLRYEKGCVGIERYWDFEYRPEPGISEEEWGERLRDALSEAVQMHMVSDVPIGAFLSGGMDSSTVVAWMSETAGSRVKTYSIGFPDKACDELPFAREIAEKFRTEHHEEIIHADAFKLLPKIVASFDEPFADSSAIPTYWVSEFAHREVKVVLSGDGGDELFGGYPRAMKELWLEAYRRFPKSIRALGESCVLKKGEHPLREPGILGQVRRFFYDARLGERESFARRSMPMPPALKRELLEAQVSEELSGAGGLDVLEAVFERYGKASMVDKSLYLDSKIYLPDDILTKVDRMSMFHSLEVRVPILDHKVVELACRIPARLKVRGRTSKWILKKAMKDKLPPAILRQRKQGFSIPIDRWFRGEFYPTVRRILLEEDAEAHRYVRKETVGWMLEAHRSGKQLFGPQLYCLLVLELWLKLGKNSGAAADTRIVDML
jgi:asparagine synthase (glutamine-hydrolysing)